MNEYRDEDKTDWFPGTEAPMRDGVYERRYYGDPSDTDFSLFRMHFWYRGRLTIGDALRELDFSGYQAHDGGTSFEWRGLKADPNAAFAEEEDLF